MLNLSQYMNPGLPEKYKEKTKLHEVKCKGCDHIIATRYKRPKCSKCGVYNDTD